MAQDRNTYAKRQRETAKKQKAEDKRARRRKRQELASSGAGGVNPPAIGQSPGDSVNQSTVPDRQGDGAVETSKE